MSEPPSASLAVEALAEEFLERQRQGERPTVAEYLERYPHLAEEIRAFFPALELLEQFKPRSGDQTGDPAAARVMAAPGAPLEQLGDYRIVREIGRGGMGVVYEAEQVSLGRRVALKVLLGHAAQDARLLARFRRESRAAAQLHHTNIVPVFEVGQHGGLSYYAMQFIRGQALDEVLRELQRLRAGSASAEPLARSLWTGQYEATGGTGGAPDPDMEPPRPVAPSVAALPDRSELSSVASNYRRYCRNVARLGLQAAEALAYAHGRGILHRDIKPANLLLDTAGVLWVSDFGLVKTQDPALTETGDLVGTLRYMAPERFKGECDARADVYALGLTLYELLALRPAFEGKDRLHLVEQIGRQEPARLRALDPRIPRDLETLIMKAIEKDPRRRYPSAEALAADLRRFLADEPVRARRVGPLERLGRWGRRNPLVAGLSAAVALVAALGFAGVFDQMQVAQANERQAQTHAVKAERKEQEAKDERDEAQRQRDEVKAVNEQLRATQDQLRATQDQLRRALYAAHMNLAQHAWDAGGVERARELLELHRPGKGENDLRSFEWHYFDRLCHSDQLTLNHTSAVRCAAYDPEGKRLATVSQGAVTVWDALSGKELLSFKGGGLSIAFSPDGKRLATFGGPGQVKVWEAETGKELFSLELPQQFRDGILSFAFGPDGKRLATGGNRVLRMWDAKTGKELRTFEVAAGLQSLVFSPDGKRLASTSHDISDLNTVRVWDAESGEQVLAFQGQGDREEIRGVAFSPDGKRLATTSSDRTAKVRDAASKKELLTLKGHTDGVWSVAFSPDGERLATASSDRTVKVWDAASGKELVSLKGHSGSVIGVSFSPDGKRLASASSDKTVRVWDSQPTNNPITVQTGGAVRCVAVSPDGKRLAVGFVLPRPAGGGLKVLDMQTGKELITLNEHTGARNGVTGVAFSPDGKRLASTATVFGPGKLAGEVKVWDLENRKVLHTLTGGGSKVAFSPDGKRLASTGNLSYPFKGMEEVKVWESETGKELLALKGGGVSVAFSPDGERLASADGKEIKLWDAQTGKELGSIASSGAVAFSPDGKRLASARSDNTVVRVWDAQTGKELLTLKGHTNGVHSVVYSNDGKRLASASADRTVKVWDAQTGEELLTLQGHSESVRGVAFSPDGHRLAAGSEDGTVKIWDATPRPENP
jgi:WD40 repeat protein/serine/threonine protein kinase